MTYYTQQQRYTLSWPDGTDLAGLNVQTYATSQAAKIAAERFAGRLRAGTLREKDLGKLAKAFIDHVVQWDLRDRDTGVGVPTTVKAFLRLHAEVEVRPILLQWVALVQTPSGPVPSPAAAPADTSEQPTELSPEELEAERFGAALEARSLTEPGENEVPVLEPA